MAKLVWCFNYEKHLFEPPLVTPEGEPPSGQLMVDSSLAWHKGWRLIGGKWYCPDCVKQLEGYDTQFNDSW